jgi:hypothetical protein
MPIFPLSINMVLESRAEAVFSVASVREL